MEIPTSFYCPISKQVMTDPVITNLGISYDKKSIIEWLNTNNTCPVTNQSLTLDMLKPNRIREQHKWVPQVLYVPFQCHARPHTGPGSTGL